MKQSDPTLTWLVKSKPTFTWLVKSDPALRGKDQSKDRAVRRTRLSARLEPKLSKSILFGESCMVVVVALKSAK